MFKKINNIPIRFKLIIGFVLIITINSISGIMSVNIMKQLGDLVNLTYDKALMSGTFAQAAKFDYSQYDSSIKGGLLSHQQDELSKFQARSTRIYSTLLEDLKVVEERALSPKSAGLIHEIIENLKLVEVEKNNAFALKAQQLASNKLDLSIEMRKNWEAGKLKNSLYKNLTALSDDAAEVGYHFRLSSEETNKKNLNRIIYILALCIAIGLILSIVISYLVITPLFKLQNVCKKVGEGDYETRSDIDSRDEFGTLAKSFNFMLNTIEEKDKNISSLLASLPFGLFYFDEKGIISKERSQATDIIFKDFSKYVTLIDFYNDHNCTKRKIQNVIDATFKELIPFESAVFLFPDLIETKTQDEKKFIQLSFKPKYGINEKLERVILIAEDVTEKNKALAESSALTERVERVSKVSYDIPGFKEFLPAIRSLFILNISILSGPSSDLGSDFKRNLHSIKGLLGIFSFNSCSTLIHELEDFIDNDLDHNISEILIKLQSAHALFEEQADDLTKLLALNTESGLKYYNSKKIDHIKQIVKKNNNIEMLNAITDLDKFPISKVLAKYSNHAATIAKKLEDKKVHLIFDPSDEISFEEAHRIESAIIHILNNSIDHGIENQTERAGKNKNETGEIRISCKRYPDQSLEFKIADDGQGINAEYLLEKAIKLGLVNKSQADSISEKDKLDLIFISGLSSKDEASETSGRGVGMDAVKHYIESIGGTINLFTKLGLGTTFSLKIPATDMT